MCSPVMVWTVILISTEPFNDMTAVSRRTLKAPTLHPSLFQSLSPSLSQDVTDYGDLPAPGWKGLYRHFKRRWQGGRPKATSIRGGNITSFAEDGLAYPAFCFSTLLAIILVSYFLLVSASGIWDNTLQGPSEHRSAVLGWLMSGCSSEIQ